jgi:hypothetical protein
MVTCSRSSPAHTAAAASSRPGVDEADSRACGLGQHEIQVYRRGTAQQSVDVRMVPPAPGRFVCIESPSLLAPNQSLSRGPVPYDMVSGRVSVEIVIRAHATRPVGHLRPETLQVGPGDRLPWSRQTPVQQRLLTSAEGFAQL